MTDMEYREKVIEEIGELKNAINLLVAKIDALEKRMDQNLQLAEGRMKGKIELIEKELNGFGLRVDKEIIENKTSIEKLETTCIEFKEDATKKRKDIHDQIDNNHDEILTMRTYQRITWGIIGAIGIGLITIIVELLVRHFRG